jgi:hypothetical protein
MKRLFTALAIVSGVLTLSSVAPATSHAGERDGALAYSLVHGLKLLYGHQYNVAERRDGHGSSGKQRHRGDRGDGYKSRGTDDYRDDRRGHGDYRDDRGHRRHGHFHRRHGGKHHGYAAQRHGKRWHGYGGYRTARACHKTSKIRYDHYGQPQRIGGVMCYDRHGRPYIVDGSRHVISRR